MKKRIIIVIALMALVFSVTPAMADMTDDVLFYVPPMVFVWGADDAWLGAPTLNDMWVLDPDPLVSNALGTDIITGVDGTTVITGTLTGAEPMMLGLGQFGSLMGILNPNTAILDNADGWLSVGDTLADGLGIPLNAATDVDWADSVQHSFYMASNCVFNVKAQSFLIAKTGDFVATPDATILGGINWTRAITVAGDDGLAYGVNAQDPTAGGGDLAPAVTNLNHVAGMPTTVVTGGQRTALTNGTIATQSVRLDNTYTVAAYDLSQGNGAMHAQVVFTIWKP